MPFRSLAYVLFLWPLSFFAQNGNVTDRFGPGIAETSAYPWMNLAFNQLQFYDRSVLQGLERAWGNTDKERFSIVYLGDSHLQTGTYPEQLAKNLQAKMGAGGYGLIFPNAVIPTYSPWGCVTSETGRWKSERALTTKPDYPLGLRGMTGHTTDPNATFKLNFRYDIPEHYTKLRIFCKRNSKSFDLEIRAGGESVLVQIDGADSLPYVEADIPPLGEDNILEVRMAQSTSKQNFFELYGLSLESSDTAGVVVHNAGVGAARYRSVLFEELFVEQLQHFEADLVVVEFGTNDYLYYDKIRDDLEAQIRKVIGKIRAGAPEATIVLGTPHDLYYKGRNCRAAIPFSELLHKIARTEGCAVYDWFWISGGPRSLRKWREERIVQRDMVHLSIKGSRFKGDVFFDALQNTMAWLDQEVDDERSTALIFEMPKVENKPVAERAPSSRSTASTSSAKRHRVRKGESPYSIAKKYGIRLSDLMRWNNLKEGQNIYVGDYLVLTPSSNKPKAATAKKARYSWHTIQKGESLWKIAQRYGVGVEDIKTWNNLKNDAIQAGQRLKIYR